MVKQKTQKVSCRSTAYGRRGTQMLKPCLLYLSELGLRHSAPCDRRQLVFWYFCKAYSQVHSILPWNKWCLLITPQVHEAQRFHIVYGGQAELLENQRQNRMD